MAGLRLSFAAGGTAYTTVEMLLPTLLVSMSTMFIAKTRFLGNDIDDSESTLHISEGPKYLKCDK